VDEAIEGGEGGTAGAEAGRAVKKRFEVTGDEDYLGDRINDLDDVGWERLSR
jgi:hypothetical protein